MFHVFVKTKDNTDEDLCIFTTLTMLQNVFLSYMLSRAHPKTIVVLRKGGYTVKYNFCRHGMVPSESVEMSVYFPWQN